MLGCAPGRCAPRCPRSELPSNAAIVGVSGSSSSQAGLLAEVDRLGTNLLTVEAGRPGRGCAQPPAKHRLRITHLDNVQRWPTQAW